MSKKKEKVCLDESQIIRLQTDTAKLAKGIHEDICPTVEDMYNENVPKELRIKGKGKKKKQKEGDGVVDKFVHGRIKGFLDRLTGDFF